ncbi:MAG: hypothetical protein RLZZ196_217 [Bacteroidota bacterium]|jgi:hypothetical protein
MDSNLPNIDQAKTQTFFNNFYAPNFAINQNTNDAIVGYFEEYTKNIESAKLLAQAVIDTAASQKIDPLQVLTQFQNLDNNELNTILSLYLNTNRIPTSLLAVKNRPVTNPYVSRTILF